MVKACQMKVQVQCQMCEVLFMKENAQINASKGKNFCSRSCSAKRRGIQRHRPLPRTCVHCQKEYRCSTIHASRSLCPTCCHGNDRSHLVFTMEYGGPGKARKRKYTGLRINFRLMTLAEATNTSYVKNKHRAYLYTHVRDLGRRWNKRLLALPCFTCSYNKHVELAHIRPLSSFPPETLLGDINAESNVVQLCPNCHWEFDHGLLKIPQKVVQPERIELPSKHS